MMPRSLMAAVALLWAAAAFGQQHPHGPWRHGECDPYQQHSQAATGPGMVCRGDSLFASDCPTTYSTCTDWTHCTDTDDWLLYVCDTNVWKATGDGGGGTTDHTALSNLAWTSSDHTGTADRVAGFVALGVAAEYTLSGNTTELGTTAGGLTGGDCVEFDANGNLVASGASCSGGGGFQDVEVGFTAGALVLAKTTTSYAGTSSTTHNATEAAAAWHCPTGGATFTQIRGYVTVNDTGVGDTVSATLQIATTTESGCTVSWAAGATGEVIDACTETCTAGQDISIEIDNDDVTGGGAHDVTFSTLMLTVTP